MVYSLFFFFQAEDGIRDWSVTGVQTCALPISRELEELNRIGMALSETRDVELLLDLILKKAREITAADAGSLYLVEKGGEIGRASCRERGEEGGVGGGW